MALNLQFTFDNDTYRHYMNGVMSVLHCHHYMALTTKMAEDFADIGAVAILAESAEDAMRPLFDNYCTENGVNDATARLKVGEEFYPVMGLGLMQVQGDENGGEVTLSRSHVDAGWQKKWGNADRPINHFTCGYVAAMFGAAFNKPARSYKVTELSSLAKGDPQSCFVITLN